MKDSVKVLLLVATMVSGIVSVYAQPGPPGGGNGNNGWGNGGGNNQGGGNGNGNFGGGNNGNGNGNGGNNNVPLDGGITLLLGAGGAVAYKTMKKKKEQI